MAGGASVAQTKEVPVRPTMDFRNHATSELTAFVDRLTAAAEKSARAASEDIAAKAKVTIDALRAERAELQKKLQEIDRTVAAEKSARAASEDTAAKAKVTIDALRAERAELQKKLQELDRKVQEQARAHAALEQSYAALEESAAEFDAANAELAASNAVLTTSNAELHTSNAALEESARSLEQELLAAGGKVDAARAETAQTRHELEALFDEMQVRLDEALAASAEATTRANEWRLDQGRAMRDQAVLFISRSLDRLLAVSESFAGVSTADEVLAAVVTALGSEFSRVALFKVERNRLEGVRQIGFDFAADMSHVVVPRAIDSVLTRAVTSGRIELLSAEDLAAASGTPFGGTPASGLALPIDLDGEAFAVLYADDSDQPHQAFANVELRVKFADLLRHQAVPLLMRLPTEQKAIVEFREYAARLVAELENMYAADVSARKKGDDLRRRLADNVECARGIYAQRVAAEAPSAGALLEEHLMLTVDAKSATAYGRDLAVVLGGGGGRAQRAPARAAADA